MKNTFIKRTAAPACTVVNKKHSCTVRHPAALSGILFLIFLFFVSCDILRFSPFEVSQWSPGAGYMDDPEKISVYLVFSLEPDRASVERHFSFLEDAKPLKGDFRWEGKKAVFLTAAPLEINHDYVISLAADARDINGLSMDNAFEGHFTTRKDNTRPLLVSFYPGMNAVIGDPRSDVRLEFSRPVSLVSLRNNVSFSPQMSGSWRLEGSEAIFTPVEPWDHGKQYELHISASLSGLSEKNMGKDFMSVFTAGEDRNRPSLTGIWRITKEGQEEKLKEDITGTFTENSGWENGDRLRLEFSKPVDTLSVKNCLGAEGASSLFPESMPGFTNELVFGFEKPPAYESRFSLTLKPGVKDLYGNESVDGHVFRVYVDGIHSKPPALVGIRLPMAPGNAADREVLDFGIDSLFKDLPINNGDDRYPYSRETETWIECYFETAPEVSINQFSVMELFRINTSNNVLTFSPRSISGSVFSSPLPRSGWGNYQRLEIRGILVNTINSGVVNVEIAPGIKDSAGNTSEKMFKISLLK